jgi:hypothetical protein
MRKIRIGNTIEINWEVFMGEGDDMTPYDLTGKNITIYLTNAFGRVRIEDYTTDGNVLRFTWEGKDQKHVGIYQMTLVENEGQDDMRTLDENDALELVRCSCMEDDEENNVEEVELSSKFDALKIYPIVPEIGDNGNWFIEGEDTGQPARGEKGEVAEIAYVYFDVDGKMDLNCSVVAGDSSLEEGFGVSDDGYLTLDPSVNGVTGNSPSSSAAGFTNLVEVESWEYEEGKAYFPANKFEQATSGNCSVLYHGFIYHALTVSGRAIIFSTACIPNAGNVKELDIHQFAVNVDTREVVEHYESISPISNAPYVENLDEDTAFLLTTNDGVAKIPVLSLLGELVNMIIELDNRVTELEGKIN